MDGKERTLAGALLIILAAGCVAEEDEGQPEIFLPPRNFNPHPYRGDAGNTGPVLFPGTAGAAEGVPYARVADRRRQRLRGRFPNQDNNVNPNVYNALDAYARKVLAPGAASSLKEYVNPTATNPKKAYKFSYKVLDHLTGDDFSHTQSQDSKATHGEYRVKLPDGRVQIVSYTADKGGYKAVVTYEDEKPDVRYEYPEPIGSGSAVYRPGKTLGKGAYFPATEEPNYYDDYGREAAYVVATTVAPYVANEVDDGYGYFGSTVATTQKGYEGVYADEVYDARRIVYRK